VEVYRLPASVIGTTVLCLALGDGDQYPGVTFGLGCDLDPRCSAKTGSARARTNWSIPASHDAIGSIEAAEDPSGVREMLDHAAYYFPKERASHSIACVVRTAGSSCRTQECYKALVKDCMVCA
jgi:ribosomal protein S12 methylthiotransferase accessory factor